MERIKTALADGLDRDLFGPDAVVLVIDWLRLVGHLCVVVLGFGIGGTKPLPWSRVPLRTLMRWTTSTSLTAIEGTLHLARGDKPRQPEKVQLRRR